MEDPNKIRLSEGSTPRWIIFVFDIFLSMFAVTFAYLLRFNFQVPDPVSEHMLYGVLLVVGVRSVSFVASKLYAGIIRHTTLHDTERILVVISIGTLILMLLNLVARNFTDHFLIPFAVLIIELFLISILFLVSRVLAKGIFWRLIADKTLTKYVLIYGTGNQSLALKQIYQQAYDANSEIVGFLSENPKQIGKKLDGVAIYSTNRFEELIIQHNVSTFLIADSTIDQETKRDLVEKALNHKVHSLTVPKVSDWINGRLNTQQIRKVKIEDLLERKPIKLDEVNIASNIDGKTVLVTGAAGSIGSEITRQLSMYKPGLIVLIDQAETPLYDIELELREEYNFNKIQVIIGDITQPNRIEKAFLDFSPDIVYHAAAYKHVPMMENHPSEAVLNNVLGTKVVADLANKYHCNKFVMVSTDKAVNPTNVMGASKRIAEIYIQSLNSISNTSFITTRFGNVLGSNGSVIPRFRKQIENGGPITITHPDITRFFMTIPEACQLVLEAGTMGKGGEILLFDMGEMVKIDDLARKMVKLAGLEPGRDIRFHYTGLRPGEKLYEELLNTKENTVPTHNPRIMIAKVQEYLFNEIFNQMNKLIELAKEEYPMEIVTKMKHIVPEYVSNNSQFEKLDSELQSA